MRACKSQLGMASSINPQVPFTMGKSSRNQYVSKDMMNISSLNAVQTISQILLERNRSLVEKFRVESRINSPIAKRPQTKENINYKKFPRRPLKFSMPQLPKLDIKELDSTTNMFRDSSVSLIKSPIIERSSLQTLEHSSLESPRIEKIPVYNNPKITKFRPNFKIPDHLPKQKSKTLRGKARVYKVSNEPKRKIINTYFKHNHNIPLKTLSKSSLREYM